MWGHATLRLCADGGANRLYDELPRLLPGQAAEAVRDAHRPDLIAGDLDSLRSHVRAYYAARDVAIRDQSSEQDSDDLAKCLTHVREARPLGSPPPHVIVVGGLGGRLDHVLSNLSALHAYRDMRVVLVGRSSTARLLPAGRNLVRPVRMRGQRLCLCEARGGARGGRLKRWRPRGHAAPHVRCTPPTCTHASKRDSPSRRLVRAASAPGLTCGVPPPPSPTTC